MRYSTDEYFIAIKVPDGVMLSEPANSDYHIHDMLCDQRVY
jgi:hypothetical protein